MVKLFLKLYFLSLIFFVTLVKIMLSETFYLICVFGPFWLPQLLLNFANRKRKAPNICYILASSILHISMPLYFLCYENNFVGLRP
jgi:hypothetical protein